MSSLIKASKHALIIGGGLAGPCLALSLAKHNIRSTIFEIRPTRSDQGGSISLAPGALRILSRYAGIYDLLKEKGFLYTRFNAYADDGEHFGQIVAGEEDKGEQGYPAIRIMRSELHKVLLEACDKEKELIDIKWGASIDKIVENEKEVTAMFEDGSIAKGDFLIGADGIHSKVRQHVLGDASPVATYTGICIVYGFVPMSSVVAPSATEIHFPAFLFTPSGMLMTLPFNRAQDTLAWGINKETPERSREGWKEFESSGEAALAAKADYAYIQTQPIRSLLDSAEDKETRLWPTYEIPDIPIWHNNQRTCLLGDAAHGMPPNGQGSGLAFEDTAILTKLLVAAFEEQGAHDGRVVDYPAIFTRFESIRRVRIAQFRKIMGTTAALKAQNGPWKWWLKKWAMRGYFWWKGGTLSHVGAVPYDATHKEMLGEPE